MSSPFFVLDLGGSTIDIVRFMSGGYHHIATLESSEYPEKDPSSWIFNHAISSQVVKDSRIVITGGRSLHLPEYYEYQNTKIFITKVHEFAAIAKGAQVLSGINEGLAVSLGTGTAMVRFCGKEWEHVKGTGIGGGTLLGLARGILDEEISFAQLAALANQGEIQNINVSVGEIVGGKIGLLDPNMTASNFAKYQSSSKKTDAALGLVSLVSESIVALAIEKSLRFGNIPIVMGGKLARLPFLQTAMKKAASLFKIPLIFPKYAGLMTAVGAGKQDFVQKNHSTQSPFITP